MELERVGGTDGVDAWGNVNTRVCIAVVVSHCLYGPGLGVMQGFANIQSFLWFIAFLSAACIVYKSVSLGNSKALHESDTLRASILPPSSDVPAFSLPSPCMEYVPRKGSFYPLLLGPSQSPGSTSQIYGFVR